MEAKIRSAVQALLTDRGVPEVSFAVEWPTDTSHGDYAINVALAAAKALNRNPKELAEEFTESLASALAEDIRGIEVAGPGFINIFLARERIAEATLAATDETWGEGESNAGKTILFEYSCPNPFKEMHLGHLVNTVVGEAASRLSENQGAKVVRDTYGGDVGPHVAKALWALRRKGIAEPGNAAEVGAAYVQGANAYEESVEAKAEIDALNVEIYAALGKEEADRTEDERALAELWRHGRTVSYEAHQAVWDALDTHFDYVLHESEATPVGMEVVARGIEQGVFERSDGAVIYKGEKKGLHTLVFITSRGTPTYETKDLGLAYMKEERLSPYDHSYIVTGAEQIGHFKVFLAALEEVAPLLANKTSHIAHGFMRLSEGKMSSRKGNVIDAVGLLEELHTKAAEKNEDPIIAHQVAVAALKYMILRSAPGSDMIFDPEKSLSLEGDSGPYLQYALVRARSVLAQEEGLNTSDAPPEPYLLERLLIRFPEVVARAERDIAPHLLVQYLTQIAGEWNSFYAQERIVGGEYEAYKRGVARAFVNTMEKGLTLLGISAPERM